MNSTSDMCRTCLAEQPAQMRPIYKLGKICGQITKLSTMLGNCTNLEFNQNDGLPDRICQQCVLQVSKAYAFIQKCITSDHHLRRFCNNDDEKPAVDDNEVDQHDGYQLYDVQEEEDQEQLDQLELQLQSQPPLIAADLVDGLENDVVNNTSSNCLQLKSDYPSPTTSSAATVHIESIEQIDENNEHILPHGTYRVIKIEETEHDVRQQSSIVYETETLDEDLTEDQPHEEDEVVEDEDEEEQEIDHNDHENDESIRETQQQQQQQLVNRKISTNNVVAVDSDNREIIPKMVYRRARLRPKGGVPQPPFKCPTCGKVLSNYSSYKYHIQLHSNETPFLCSECGEGFRTRNAYDGHMVTHADKNPHTCKQCGKSYRQAASLRCHLMTHSGEKPFTCDICGKGMTQKSGYKKHMLTHSGEKPHQCDMCGKDFRYSSNLIMHKRAHTGNKPFNCDVCDKRFIGCEQLKRHKLIHSGERPFGCDVCGKSFNRKSTLQVHKNIHIGDRKHECQICGKAYIQLRYLMAHMECHGVTDRAGDGLMDETQLKGELQDE